MISFTGIAKSVKVNKGDSIITSGLSLSIPKGLMIGTVAEIIEEKSTNNFLIKIKTSADFNSLQLAYVISDLEQEPIKAILEKAKTTTR
jgi:rod shape-determining protein MreC